MRKRFLTAGEIALARSIFGEAIDYRAVRLVEGKWWPLQPRRSAMAPMGNIYFHPEGGGWSDDFSLDPLHAQGFFIHEMTHVWQAQAKGRFYLPLMRHPFCHYRYRLVPGRRFDRYGLEQQAEIVRHRFLAKNGVLLTCPPPIDLLPFVCSVPVNEPRDSSSTRRSLLIGAGGVAAAPAVLKAVPGGSKAHVAVVGAGVFGTWTAVHLLRQGHRVTLIDAHGPAHARASSGGESRLTRGAYGKDLIYTRMAFESLKEWKSLSAVSGHPIFHECGVLFFFSSEDDYVRDSLAAHKKLGLPISALTSAKMQARFPMIDFAGVDGGLFEPGFGALMARRSVQTLADGFVHSGGKYFKAAVAPPSSLASGRGGKLTELQLENGERISADRFVFAAGPWLPKLFPDVVGPRIRPTRQEVFFFAPPAGDRRFLPGAMPGWADFNGGDFFYGFPDLEARGVKFAHDVHGVEVDPDTQDRRPSDAGLADIVAFRDRRFPLLRGAPLTGAEVCQYENSSNGDFLIDFHPRLANVLLVGGGSGHGFKHGPEVGRYAAARLLGSGAIEPRFSLASKSESHKREVH